MTATEILARVASVYASCRTYSDEAEVSTKFADVTLPRSDHFFTAFVRPANFRFELRLNLRSRQQQFIAWKDGSLEKSSWPLGVREQPLDETLLAFSRTSPGSAVTVPALLLPDLFSGKGLFASLAEIKLTGEEKVEGRRTFKIEGKLGEQSFKLWIDTDQFVIIKTHQKIKVNSLEQETITKYRPLVNGEVRADQLSFNPPLTNATPGARQVSSAAGSPSSGSDQRAPTPSEEPPRLKQFGSSLRPSAKDKDNIRKEKKDASDEEYIVRVDTDLVVCDLLVIDQQGRLITGLVKDDFVIKEDNQLQEVGSFSLGDNKNISRSIVLILDYSSSQLPYIKTSVEAAKTLVDKLNLRDRMALVTDDVKLLVDFTSDKELLKAKLESLKARAMSGWLGRSKQYDALTATLNELFGKENLRPIVIFQTDGDQLDALMGNTLSSPNDPYMPPKSYRFEDLVTNAERARITIYSIIPGVPFVGLSKDEQLKQAERDLENRQESYAELTRLYNVKTNITRPTPSLESLSTHAALWSRLHLALIGLAKSTGGWSDYLVQPGQADELYTRVLSDINTRYVIGYYPTNRSRDGKRRKISIEVRGHPEYIVWGRKTYFAPQS